MGLKLKKENVFKGLKEYAWVLAEKQRMEDQVNYDEKGRLTVRYRTDADGKKHMLDKVHYQMDHKYNGGQTTFRLPTIVKPVPVDAYLPEVKTVLQFHGYVSISRCYFHPLTYAYASYAGVFGMVIQPLIKR